MSRVTVNTSLDDLPAVLSNFADQIPYATSVALNNTAFGLMRHEKSEMAKELDLKNTWTQRGMRVDKSSKRDLTARVGNIRWWMESLAEGGERRPKVGINHKGRRYLLVPSKEMRTATGKLRSLKSKNLFVFKSDNDSLLLAYRKTKKRLPLVIVGRLELETDYDADTYPHDEIVSDYIAKHWDRNWKQAMVRAARPAK